MSGAAGLLQVGMEVVRGIGPSPSERGGLCQDTVHPLQTGKLLLPEYSSWNLLPLSPALMCCFL